MSCNSNCEFGELIYPEANSDVSGIGVMIGFLFPMYMALIITTFYYVLGYNPMVSYEREGNDSAPPDHKPNPVDLFLYRLFRLGQSQVAPSQVDDDGIRVGSEQASTVSIASHGEEQLQANGKIAKAFGKCILSLADIQLFTGLAILVSGYANLYQGISIYHWQKLVLLAWCANVTHLCALTFLRNHFYNNKVQRAVRLVLMTVLAILLIVALIPTGDYAMGRDDHATDWYGGGECAKCFFGSMNKWRSLDTMIPSLLMLLYSSVIRAFKLFPEFTQNQGRSIRSSVSNKCQRIVKRIIDKLNGGSQKNMIEVARWTALFVVVRFYFDLYISMAAEVYFLYFSVVWGTYRLFHVKVQDGPDGEQLWGFGQVIPVVLLLGPIFALADSLSDIGKLWAAFSPRDLLMTLYRGIRCFLGNVLSGRSITDQQRPCHTASTPNQQQPLDEESILQLSRPYATDSSWYGYLVLQCIIFSSLMWIRVFHYSQGNATKGIIAMALNIILSQPMASIVFVWASYVAEVRAWERKVLTPAFVFSLFWVILPFVLSGGYSMNVVNITFTYIPFMIFVLFCFFAGFLRRFFLPFDWRL